MVDVVDEPHRDASVLGAVDRSLEDLRGLVVQPDVVERELEALLRSAEELGHLVCDVDGGLAAVAVVAGARSPGLGPQRGLVRPLGRLVLGERLR